jgi:hypothetical protein
MPVAQRLNPAAAGYAGEKVGRNMRPKTIGGFEQFGVGQVAA